MTKPVDPSTLKPQDAYFLQCFAYETLPKNLQLVCQPFYDLACTLITTLPNNSDRSATMQKLIETKDCAVRSALNS